MVTATRAVITVQITVSSAVPVTRSRTDPGSPTGPMPPSALKSPNSKSPMGSKSAMSPPGSKSTPKSTRARLNLPSSGEDGSPEHDPGAKPRGFRL